MYRNSFRFFTESFAFVSNFESSLRGDNYEHDTRWIQLNRILNRTIIVVVVVVWRCNLKNNATHDDLFPSTKTYVQHVKNVVKRPREKCVLNVAIFRLKLCPKLFYSCASGASALLRVSTSKRKTPVLLKSLFFSFFNEKNHRLN